MVKRGEEYFQNSGGSWLKRGVKKLRGGGGGFGPWMKLWWLVSGMVSGWVVRGWGG